jgi:hypothetical protein
VAFYAKKWQRQVETIYIAAQNPINSQTNYRYGKTLPLFAIDRNSFLQIATPFFKLPPS